MPAKRCVETKNMCLLFVDYCKNRNDTQVKDRSWGIIDKKLRRYPDKKLSKGIVHRKTQKYPRRRL